MVLLQCRVSHDWYPPEDLASDLALKIVSSGRGVRYDVGRASLETYVSVCMRRIVISWLRKRETHVHPVEVRPGTLQADHDAVAQFESVLRDVLATIPDQPLRGVKGFVLGGVRYKATMHSICRLLATGYSYADIARAAKTDPSNLMRAARRLAKACKM